MPRPPISPLRLLLAVLLAGPGLVAGVALHLAPDGTLDRRLTGGRATVTLHPDTPLIVWSTTPEDVSCDLADGPPEGSITIVNTLVFDRYELRADGVRWHGVQSIVADPAGTYELRCAGRADLAVGAPPWSHRLRNGGLRTMLTFGVPVSDRVLGVLVALPGLVAAAVVIVTGRRRLRAGPPAAV